VSGKKEVDESNCARHMAQHNIIVWGSKLKLTRRHKQDKTGQTGQTEQGRAGQGRAGQGRAGTGRAGQDGATHLFVAAGCKLGCLVVVQLL
jgi:hypothetical protein